MLFKGWREHGYNHTGKGFACTCDAREKGNLTEVDRWQNEDFDADIALHLPWSCLWKGMMMFKSCYYTLLHTITQKARNIDTLAGEVPEPGDRKIQFITSPERPCCSYRPSRWYSGKSRIRPFFRKIAKRESLLIITQCYILLHCIA